MLDQATIDRIRSFDGGGLPVVSVYVALETDPADRRSASTRLASALKPVRELADSGELGREASLSLRDDVEAIQGLAGEVAQVLGKSVAIFSSSGNKFLEMVRLPQRTKDRTVVDASPYVRPMLAILDEHHRYCAVVVERPRSFIYEFYMGELEEIDLEQAETGRKKNYGGWYGLEEHRVRSHAKEESHRHYRETARAVFELYCKGEFDLLLVGGHEATVAEFTPFLHPYVRQRLAGTFTIDPHTITPALVRDACEDLVARYERDQERQMVEQLLDTVGAGGRAVVGLERTLAAANVAAVDLLLVHDDATAPGAVCDQCGFLATEPGECPVDGSQMRGVPDVVEELVDDVIDERGQVEHVYADTPLAEHLVGALTRFDVPEF